MVVEVSTQIFGAALTALQRYDLTNLIAATTHLCQAGAVVLAVHLDLGLAGIAAATLLVALGSQLARVWAVMRLLDGVSLSRRYFDRDTLKQVFSYGGVSVVGFLSRVGSRFGLLAIGLMSGPVAVTFFAIPEGLIQKARTTNRALTSVLMPAASQMEAAKDMSSLIAATGLD